MNKRRVYKDPCPKGGMVKVDRCLACAEWRGKETLDLINGGDDRFMLCSMDTKTETIRKRGQQKEKEEKEKVDRLLF